MVIPAPIKMTWARAGIVVGSCNYFKYTVGHGDAWPSGKSDSRRGLEVPRGAEMK